MSIYIIFSLMSYAAFLLAGVIWDGMPAGTEKSIMFCVAFVFLLVGAGLAAFINNPDKMRDDGLSDEDYEELIRMVEERKKQLDDD